MEDTNTWEIGNLAEVTVSYILKGSLEQVDVSLMDHLILSPEGKWLSFRERRLI